MDTAHYDMLRHFADSWGLLYMMGIFLIVVIFLMLPGAKSRAVEAAQIPLNDEHPLQGDRR